MERGGTSRAEARASVPRSSSAPPADASFWITPPEEPTTARRGARASRAAPAAMSSRPKQTGRCIAVKIASVGVTSATTVEWSSSGHQSPQEFFAALSATTSGNALSGRCAMRAAGTRLSKCRPELQGQNLSTARAVINGCWNTVGSCSRNLAGRLAPTRTCITSTASAATTGRKIWNCGNGHSPQESGPPTTTARVVLASSCRKTRT